MKIFKEWKKAFSIPLTIHWSIVILLSLFIMTYGLFFGSIYCFLIIGSILIHEYAHVWIAQRGGAKVTKVVIMALGAAAMIEPTSFIGKFGKELKCAIAGPVASLILSILFLPFALITVPKTILFAVFSYLFLINLAACLFNLLPIYPMDGGRILNALLSMLFSRSIGKYNGAILAIKTSSIIAYCLSAVAIFVCFIYNYLFMGMMFIFIIIFTYINKKSAINQYNNKYFPPSSDH